MGRGFLEIPPPFLIFWVSKGGYQRRKRSRFDVGTITAGKLECFPKRRIARLGPERNPLTSIACASVRAEIVVPSPLCPDNVNAGREVKRGAFPSPWHYQPHERRRLPALLPSRRRPSSGLEQPPTPNAALSRGIAYRLSEARRPQPCDPTSLAKCKARRRRPHETHRSAFVAVEGAGVCGRALRSHSE